MSAKLALLAISALLAAGPHHISAPEHADVRIDQAGLGLSDHRFGSEFRSDRCAPAPGSRYLCTLVLCMPNALGVSTNSHTDWFAPSRVTETDRLTQRHGHWHERLVLLLIGRSCGALPIIPLPVRS